MPIGKPVSKLFRPLKRHAGVIALAVAGLVAIGVLIAADLGASKNSNPTASSAQRVVEPADSLAVVLVPPVGDGRVVDEIKRIQTQVRSGNGTELALERLGWLFVARGRESFDSGFYKLAERCAAALDARKPGDTGA